MTGPAVQAGSPIGGFIEGVSGGFSTITDFKRRRRLEQQVAEQLRVQGARQGREDTLAAEDRERAAEDRLRAQQLEDLELFQETGIVRTPRGAPAGAVQEVPESVSNLRGATGARILEGVGAQGLPAQVVSPTATRQPGADPRAVGAGSLPPGFIKIGPSADEREAEERSGFLGKVAEFMALSPEEREAAMQDPAMRQALDELGTFDDVFDVATAPPAASSLRFGVTGTGGRTLTGGTRQQADEFAAEFPHTPSPRTPGDLSVQQAYEILKDSYAKFEDDGTGKLVFSGYEKPLDVILTEARQIARGGPMTPRAPEPEVVEGEEGPGFFEKAEQAIRRFQRPEVSSGESPSDRFLQVPGAEEERGPRFMEAQMRALELEEEGKTREDIRRIMLSEGYKVR
jgi:hypothetical protein